MKLKLYFFCLNLLIVSALSGQYIFAQDSTISLAFKKSRFATTYPLFYTPDLSYQLKQQFQLIKMANSGDPLAQHELGLRYLQGLDMPSDTLKAAEWIKKAALQDLPAACYNYAILLLNGWGVPWNPFEAFLNFKKAAEAGMAQAQYIIGVLYIENLIVKKDRKAAEGWLKKASAQNYEPAIEMLKELGLEKEVDSTKSEIAGKAPLNSSPLVFIDFDLDSSSFKEISEKDLTNALPLSENEELINAITAPDSSFTLEKLNFSLLEETAEAGSPEALTMLGFLYENGKYFQRNIIRAGNYYYRAAKLDSRNGAYLLWKLNNSSHLYKELEKYVKSNDPEAMFLLYGLKSFNLTDIISETAAKELLFKAEAQGLESAIIETGVNIYSGKYKEFERKRGIEILRTETQKGNLIAEERYISIKIIDSLRVTSAEIERLFFASSRGSILAETLLGVCYKEGLAVRQDIGTAVKYFRRAAQRGSTFAFEQLKELHNSLRPPGEMFLIN